MKEISTILQEAKPLYYKQKRRKEQIKKMCFSLVMIVTVIASGFSGYAIKASSTAYIASSEITTTTESSSYLPVDEYGLITVAY